MFFGDLINLEPVVNALGWALTHFIWQGLLIGGLFWLGNRILRSATPGARYTFGLFCLVLLLIVPVVTGYLIYQQPSVVTHEPVGVTDPILAVPAPPTQPQQIPEVALEQPLDIEYWADKAMPAVVMIWCIGVLLMSLRVGLNWYRMRRLTRVGIRPLDAGLQARVETLLVLFGIRRAVKVFESAIVQVPTVMGWLRPVILLPTSSLTGLTPTQLELVIAHELGHVRRFDYLVNLLQVFIETLLFYHPVVGWISRQVRDEREKCCDDLVISRCDNRLEYAKALGNLAMIHSADISPALGATGGQLVQRIERIVGQHSEQKKTDQGNVLAVLTLALAVFLAGRAADPLSEMPADGSTFSGQLIAEFLINRLPAQTEALLAPLERTTLFLSKSKLLQPATESNAVRQMRPEKITQPALQPTSSADDPIALVPVPQESISVQADPQTSVNVADELSRMAQNLELPAERLLPSIPEASQGETEASSKPVKMLVAFNGNAVTKETMTAPVAETESESLTGQKRLADAPLAPKAVRRISPHYPERAIGSKRSGVVTIEFGISRSGRPIDIEVVNRSPGRTFNWETKRAFSSWRFDPATSHLFEGQRFTKSFIFEYHKRFELTEILAENESLEKLCSSARCVAP